MKNKKFIKSTAIILAAVSLSATIGTVIFSESFIDSVQAASVDSFKDVQDKNKFFYNPVYWASSNKITTGFNDNTFRPDDTCTRGQAVTFLWRYENEPKPDTVRYLSDTKNSSFKDSISWALSTGVTTGFDDGTFRQDNPVTRGQIVTFMWRDAGCPDVKSSNSFSDVSESSAFAKAINWAAKYGITTGFEDNTFRQDQYCTRGQIVTFLYRWSALKGDDISTNAHPEDEVFMAYLRILYGRDTLDGVPFADRQYKCKKFAIADFDADDKNELMIEYSFTWTDGSEITAINMYEANLLGNKFEDSSVSWIPDKSFADVTFLNNGVAYSENYAGSLDGIQYFLISDELPSRLNYNMSLADFDSKARILFYYDNGGKIYKTLASQQATLFEPEEKTKAEYEKEKKILNNGKVMDITIKDCTKENIGFTDQSLDLNDLVEKAKIYYENTAGQVKYNADLYNSGLPGEGIYLVVMDEKNVFVADYMIDKISGIGIDTYTGNVVDFSKI